ncbi:helix-turn-helix domain-containing protein [bacterium]|nr:helix-turn-helix domain-containing protein [bacterium]
MSTIQHSLDTLLTLREAAELLGVSRSTLRRWAKQGDLPYVRISTRGDIRIPRAALQQFISDRLSQPEEHL